MRIVVTGGAGFVGSAIVRRLLESKHHVRVLDDLSTGRVANIMGLACDFEQIDAGKADYANANAIVHAAAYPDVSANWKHPSERERQWQSNAELTRRILDRVPSGVPFVLLSTCSVYGGGVVDERSLVRATSPYAASKIAAEALVMAYHEAQRVRAAVLRLVNVVGPRYAHGHLADFVRQVKATGKLHALDDGVKRKSFVHVDDVADAVENALVAPGGRVANVTSEVLWSWRDSVAVMQAMKGAFPVTCEARPSGWVGDPDELKVTPYGFGWCKRSIVEGVAQSLRDCGW